MFRGPRCGSRRAWTEVDCCNVLLTVDVNQEGFEQKKQLEELIHVAGLCIEVLQQNDEYLADVSLNKLRKFIKNNLYLLKTC